MKELMAQRSLFGAEPSLRTRSGAVRPSESKTGFFFFSSRRRHTRFSRDWSSDVCSSDLPPAVGGTRSRRRSRPSGRAGRTLRPAGCVPSVDLPYSRKHVVDREPAPAVPVAAAPGAEIVVLAHPSPGSLRLAGGELVQRDPVEPCFL